MCGVLRNISTACSTCAHGKNKLTISLREMRSKALSQISEICFVIHPEDVIEEQGRNKDLLKVTEDTEYLKHLYEEFQI